MHAFRAFVAAVGVALILALTVLAGSPEAHAWLHTDADHPGHTCAVALYAHGISADLAPVAVCEPAPAWQAPRLPEAKALLLQAPRFLRLPGRGPPAVA